LGCESPFDDHDATPEDPVLHEVAIAGKADDEGPYEMLAQRGFSLHQGAGNLDRHVVRVVRHDAVLVRSAPRLEVLVDERFDVRNGCECGRSCHDSSFHCRKLSTVMIRPLRTDYLSPGRGNYSVSWELKQQSSAPTRPVCPASRAPLQSAHSMGVRS